MSRVQLLTTLGRAKIFPRSRRSGSTATGFLDAQSATFNNFTLETFLRCISLVGSDHFDKPKATGLFSMRIVHDRAVFNVSVFLEQTRNVGFRESWRNASDKQIRSSIDSTLFIFFWDTL